MLHLFRSSSSKRAAAVPASMLRSTLTSFSLRQRLWGRYYLGAAIPNSITCVSFSSSSSVSASSEDAPKVRIMFGSQTGTAQLFAVQLAGELSESTKFSADDVYVSSIDEAAASGGGLEDVLSADATNILIASVCGKGQAPENASRFYDWLKNQNGDAKFDATNVRYAVFGCGNLMGYKDTFNVVGKFFDQRLEELGATRVHELGLGDDSGDIEEDFDKWCEGLVETLMKKPESTTTTSTAMKKPESTTTTSTAIDGETSDLGLSEHTIHNIRDIWTKIQAHTGSASAGNPYGRHFYSKLVAMDSSAASLFGNAQMSILSRDFDSTISDFVSSLDDTSSSLLAKRDDFLGRMIRYRVQARTLWLGGDAFRSAVIALSPLLASKASGNCGLDPWSDFYYKVLFPPLHPAILKSIDYIDSSFFRQDDVSEKFKRALLTSGHFHAAEIISSRCPEAIDLIAECVSALMAWKNDSGEWEVFDEACQELLTHLTPHVSDYDENHLSAICTLLALRLPDACHKLPQVDDGIRLAKKFEDTLLVIAANIAGPQRMIEALRDKQLNVAMDSWNRVYASAHKEFGETFYRNFTRDPDIAAVFQRTDISQQRKRFVHQFNSIMIRLNETDKVLLPLVREVGARHRLYRIGKSEVQAISQPIFETMEEMYGIVHWNNDLRDAWGYVIDFIVSNMLIGWSGGMATLPTGFSIESNPIYISDNGEWSTIDMKKIRNLQKASPEAFTGFFEAFADKTKPSFSTHDVQNISLIAERYRKVVEQFIVEDDLLQMREKMGTIGRRHKNYHGVQVQDLKAASSSWMQCADEAFGSLLTYDVALEWAKLWSMIASSLDDEYSPKNGCPSFQDLAAAYEDRIDRRPARKKSYKCELQLREKKVLPGHIAHLIFNCSPPLAYEAGQYSKIRWTMPDGEVKIRFYSIASAPGFSGENDTMELCIKEVPGGLVSTFVVGDDFVPPKATASVVMTAGHFTLPSPMQDSSRFAVSGGIGIVAFIGVIRAAAELSRADKLDGKKLSLSLLHCEQTPDFPFRDLLLELADEFSTEKGKSFDFTLGLCITRDTEGEVAKLAGKYPHVTWKAQRPDRDILRMTLDDLSARGPPGAPSPEVYICGPGPFQKAMRETCIDGLGLNKKTVHQEFFDA